MPALACARPLPSRSHHGPVARAGSITPGQEAQALGRLDFPMAPVWLHAGRKPG